MINNSRSVMLKVLCLTLLVGVTLRVTRADDDAANKESQCIEEIKDELEGYIRSEIWQELFKRHYKFIVDENGKILSKRKRLKFNTIMHNALYGCSHDYDYEVDDCPYIRRGSIKSCKSAINLRAAMFRTARCAFVESSIKHLVLSDILLDTFPLDKLDEIAELADQPIREFGEPVANVLSVLAHGETGGVAELTAVHLYLNNAYGTVLMDRAPPGPVRDAAAMLACRDRARAVHAALLGPLRTFFGTWCGDRDVEAQCRARWRSAGRRRPADVGAAVRANTADAADLVRALNVAAGADAVHLDFAPDRLALARYTARLVAHRFAPEPLVAELRVRRFEAAYEFAPRALYDGYLRGTVFGTAYACFYWAALAHVRLAERYLEDARWRDGGGDAVAGPSADFAEAFGKFAGPLTVFRVSQLTFADPLPPLAAFTVARLRRFVVRLSRDLTGLAVAAADGARDTRRVLSAARREMRELVARLSADMLTAVPDLAEPPSPDYFAGLGRDEALELMRSNYRAFVRLVVATSGHAEDRANLVRLKRFFFYASEAVGFDG